MPQELEDRMRRTLTPTVIQAEDYFLYACLAFQWPELQAEALTSLRPDDLQPSNALILAAAQAVQASGQAVEHFTVDLELQRRGEVERSGGCARLWDVNEGRVQASPTLLRWAVGVIRGARQAQKLWEAHDRMGEYLADGDMPLDQVRSRIASDLQAPAETDDRAYTLADAMRRQLERLEGNEPTLTLRLGLAEVDRKGGGLEAGEVGLICGMPGSGKSALMAMQAIHAARTWGPVAFISLEMSSDRIALRELAKGSRFSFHELRDNRTADGRRPMDADWDSVEGAHLLVFENAKKIYIEHQTFELAEIVARLRYLKARFGVKAALIDYGQLIGAQVRRGGTQTEEQSIIARALKNEVATTLGMPVWCLVQPNKDQTRRGETSALKMSDIAGASEWRAVANQIWLLYRDTAAQAPEGGWGEGNVPMLLDIAKSRDGGQATIPLILLGERFLFVERDTHREWEGRRDVEN